jgi:exopolysaccharide biosynthesis polyprenyl glycosylphosphotransferase
LADYPVDLRLAPDLAAYRGGGDTGPEVGKLRLLRLADRPMRGFAGAAKTVEDYVLALGALAVAAVPMALIALAVKLDSPGPVLFRQRRTGFNNKDFFVFKFRTMYHEHADYDVQRQVEEGDPRVTRVGAILRRTSLDELPQIFNVLRGEMSFIGPRPHAPGTRAGGTLFEEVTDRYAARHRVKPGLTGLAQVRGYRGKTDTEEKLILRVESDLEYIENWSLWLDVVILVRTLLAVARMRNAH